MAVECYFNIMTRRVERFFKFRINYLPGSSGVVRFQWGGGMIFVVIKPVSKKEMSGRFQF